MALAAAFPTQGHARETKAAREHFDRAYAFDNAVKPAEALAEYRAAIRLDPDGDGDWYWRAGEMELALGRPRRAIPLLKRACRMGLETGGREVLALARAYEEAGMAARAKRVLERYAADNPMWVRAPLTLVGLLSRLNKCEAARLWLAKSEQIPAIKWEDSVPFLEDARRELGSHCDASSPSNPPLQTDGASSRR